MTCIECSYLYLNDNRIEIWLLYMLSYPCADYFTSACDNHVETEDQFNAKNINIYTLLRPSYY